MTERREARELMICEGMAYRGDTTDPLQNIINRQGRQRRMVLLFLVMWVVPSLLRTSLSSFESLLGTSRSLPSAPLAAPTTHRTAGAKMSASALEQMLGRSPASHAAPRDVRCLPLQTGWDYVCTYQADVPHPQARFKIGVRVRGNAIVQASAPHPIDRVLAGP